MKTRPPLYVLRWWRCGRGQMLQQQSGIIRLLTAVRRLSGAVLTSAVHREQHRPAVVVSDWLAVFPDDDVKYWCTDRSVGADRYRTASVVDRDPVSWSEVSE